MLYNVIMSAIVEYLSYNIRSVICNYMTHVCVVWSNFSFTAWHFIIIFYFAVYFYFLFLFNYSYEIFFLNVFIFY